jgi:DNA-binding transcriptional MerR regulator
MSQNSDNEKPPESEVVWLDDGPGRGNDPFVDGVLSIGNVAETFGVSQLTLRYYEWRGLIRRRRSVDNVWVYRWADCERLAFIIKCRRVGIPLPEIAAIMRAANDDVSPLEFTIGQKTCMALIAQLSERRRAIGEALDEIERLHSRLSARLLADVKSKRRC